MNIHEYQAKAVLSEFGVPVPKGKPIFSPEEAESAAREIGGPLWVVKSQIHAGGRGKGKFKEPQAGEKGGVRLARSIDEGSVDLLIELVDDLGRCGLRCTDAVPAARLVTRHDLGHGRDIRQRV